MKGAHPNWKSLPVEILLKIFQDADEKPYKTDAREFGLVCKSWFIPAQTVLYSRVFFSNLSKLKKFQNIVEQDPQLGKKVKTLYIRMDSYRTWNREPNEEAATELFDLLSNLLSSLPNLEIFDDESTQSYVPILNALQDSHLQRLKKLKMPSMDAEKSELTNYATCALYMKDRLEKLWISDRFKSNSGTSNRQLYFDRLYNKMHQFEKLKSLNIGKKTSDEIQAIEHITQFCKSLEELHFNISYFDSVDDFSLLNSGVSIDAISMYIPACAIKALKARMGASSDNKALLYIMHKFPHLDRIFLYMHNNDSDWRLNYKTLTQLLNYSLRIDYVNIFGLKVDLDVVSNTIENHWEINSKLGSEKTNIVYTD